MTTKINSNNSICRACLRNNIRAVYNLFDDELARKFTECTSIEIFTEDTFPSIICFECYKLLISFYSFKQLCLKSSEKLKENNYQKGILSDGHTMEDELKLQKNIGSSFEDLSEVQIVERKRRRKKKYLPKILECKICTKKLSHITALNNHMKTHKPSIEKKYYNCSQCKKWFYTEERLEGHLRIHEGKKQAVCKVCGKDFQKWSGLKQHMIQHEGDKKYSCHVCGRLFFFDWALRSHEKTHTILEFPVSSICDMCGKSFSSIGNLKMHMQIHSEEKPFPCTLCEKKFKLEGSLREHILRHNGIKNYVCPVCRKAFTTHSEMMRHTVLHSEVKPFTCNQCGRQFKRKALLVNHLKIHSALKPHKCDTCQKCFSSSTILVEHKRTHTGEKPHICYLCKRAFAQKTVLRNHLKSCERKQGVLCGQGLVPTIFH